jgi:hypothetical protein
MSGRVGSITTDIIADGLVFNMDAANRASYVPDATKSHNTIDLSQTGSLQDTGMFSADNKGVFVCDGVDTGIALNSTTNLGTTNTVSIWVKRDTTSTEALFGGNTHASNAAMWLAGTTSLYVSISKWVKPFFYVAGWSNTTDWFHITVTRNGDTANLYKNGAFIDDLTGLGTGDTLIFSIGYNSANNGNYYSGEIGPAHLYNRVLSATEVLHNYNALKGRFGL